MTRRLGLVLAAMTLANAMILVDQTAVPVSLPSVMEDLGVATETAQWVLNASLLPLAGLLVFGGRLGDLLGLRRVFLAGSVMFAGASAIGGLAPDIEILLAARVVQGIGGALMLPATVAIVSSTFAAEQRGRALGTMGGAAAVFAALGPTIGGTLTSAFDWRAVLLVNVPLAVVTVLLTLRHVEDRPPTHRREHIDLLGTMLLCTALVGLVFGLSEIQDEGITSPVVWVPLLVAVLATITFVVHERRARAPLVDFALLRHRNYLGASLSQLLAGMAEIGLGVIFPLVLILNLQMSPAIAGLALIPTTLPMIIVAPLAGRWYDRNGGRQPLVAGFLMLALSAVVLAFTVAENDYVTLLPGLLLYGIGLALVLTVNDPTSLDSIPAKDEGQASGVAATAEQFGGALGIAVLYSIFHEVYVTELDESVDRARIPDLTDATAAALRDAIQAAEATGLSVDAFDVQLRGYLTFARDASNVGYESVFVAVAVLATVAALLVAWLVRKPPAAVEGESTTGAAASAGAADDPA